MPKLAIRCETKGPPLLKMTSGFHVRMRRRSVGSALGIQPGFKSGSINSDFSLLLLAACWTLGTVDDVFFWYPFLLNCKRLFHLLKNPK
jgi:hypothetical protein